MRKILTSWLLRAAALMASVVAVSGLAVATTQYVVTNDDVAYPFVSGVSFYSVAPNGSLTLQQHVQTGGNGIGGGFFGANRTSVLNSGNQQCVFASQAFIGEITGIAADTLTVAASVTGSPTDGGTSNGIGLALNSQYLYASFTDSNTIGTFSVQAGCSLSFINDVSVGGLTGGIVNGMAIHGNMLIATYTDGSIESFDISAGTPLSHGDKQYSTATLSSQDATYPNSIDITSDGHYAIFGDTSTSVVVEVSDISSGKLTPTVVHKTKTSISSSNVMLSPDETLLYVINTQGASVSAIFFDKTTGTLSGGCKSGRVKGESANWSYLAGLALASQTGNGGGVYVAEFGSPSGIALVSLTVTGQKCSLQEVKGSPFVDTHSQGLLSIGTFPPRSF
jgi:6-phosphogluconolactonase (cycloisomerase 2 family)